MTYMVVKRKLRNQVSRQDKDYETTFRFPLIQIIFLKLMNPIFEFF